MTMLLNKSVRDTIPKTLPVIPTMDVVVFPNMIVPLLILDERIIKGIEESVEESKKILLVAAKNQIDHNGAIGTEDLYNVGTVASIMRLIKLPEGGIKVLVQGICKAHIDSMQTKNDTLHAKISPLAASHVDSEDELKAQIKNIKALTEKMSLSGISFSPDFHAILAKMTDPNKIADFILSHLNLSVKDAQKLLETTTQEELLEGVYQHLSKEIELSEIQERIRNRARESMNKSQKEYYLREQIRAIKDELGEDDGEELEKMRTKLESIPLPDDVKDEVARQLNRLERTSPDSMEAAVIRNYLEWIFALPWDNETVDNLDLNHAKQILDEDHFGLAAIKDRILDYISIRNLKQDGHAPILCFVGPPGTGKTSLGKSIAKSLGRSYFRVSLGGVKDEAEIRGHRRTYVGAMPGRFIQGIRKAGTKNPLIIIDELDKIGSDFRGDPSAAMLEVLDPQQNRTFYDNYLGVPFDLSKVMFIATANSLDTISEPLKDRMDIIHLSGYTLEEKTNIAQKYIVPRAIHDAGLESKKVTLNDEIIQDIISNYTRESGVRQLDRIIRTLCSKIARVLVEKDEVVTFSTDNIETYLGPRKFISESISTINEIGITNGLAWTSFGGEMLKIEAVRMPGTGKLLLTGQLGDVMKESAQAALSYARAHADKFGIAPERFVDSDLHIHVPAGAVPKDGPSAGVTMLTSILSSLTGRPINARCAMTGELNLRGDVMPIGGVKEKILAAKRNKIQSIFLPSKNKNDLIGMEDITQDIEIIWADHANDILDKVLLNNDDEHKKEQS